MEQLPTLRRVIVRIALGPQSSSPTLRKALLACNVALTGPIVSITAGWQEREGEVTALERHLERPIVDLRLYARAESVFGADPALHAAYRRRQADLRRAQEIYRLRLDRAMEVARTLADTPDDDALVRSMRSRCNEALRRVDADHRQVVDTLHDEFARVLQPSHRPAVAQHAAELERAIDSAGLILIAGGHLAVLLNRLRLFDVPALLARKSLAAWSAGAMVLAGTIVLYHDHAARGRSTPEVLDAGFGLVAAGALLPDASARLALSDSTHVGLLAVRCEPEACYTLDAGEWLAWTAGQPPLAGQSRRFTTQGRLTPVPS